MRKLSAESKIRLLITIPLTVAVIVWLPVAWEKHNRDLALSRIERYTGITPTEGEMFSYSVGFTDSATYIRFQATKEEFLKAVNELNLKEQKWNFAYTIDKFRWWKPERECTSCMSFHSHGYNSDVWMQHNTSTGTTYYLSISY